MKDTRAGVNPIGRLLAGTAVFLAALAGTALAQPGDGELRVRARNGADIETMDPAFYRGNEESNLDGIIYSRLVQFEPGSSELVLDAAESLEVSEDGMVVTFTLREGIQFHHGYGELTAEDVKFSFERFIDPDINSPYAGDWATLVEVEVTGRYEGRIILDAPYAPLLISTLPWTPGSIVSRAAFEDRGDQIALQPVGSGPYYWSSWTPNQELVLERNDDYYGEHPDFQRIVVLPILDPLIAEFSFDAGELDATEISLESMDRYESDPAVSLAVLAALRYHWLGFNIEAPPFDDERVREAVRYVIDVDEIIAGAYSGVPERANAMLAPGVLGYWEDAPQYEPDLERARELLAEAGHPDGFSTVLYTDTVVQHTQAVAIIQQQLARIGITVDISIESVLYEALADGPPGLHYAAYSGVLDPDYWFEWFTCDQIGVWNYWRWCDEEFEALKREAAVLADADERALLYVRMQELIDEAITAVWITNGANVYAYRHDEIEPEFIAMYSQYHYWRDLRD